MKDNFLIWEIHYREILEDLFGRFAVFMAERGEPAPDYDIFARYCFDNTKKYPILDKKINYAPIN